MSDTVSLVIVKGTFALLLFGSVVTWALVLFKTRQRWVSRSQDRRFLAAAPTPFRLTAIGKLDGHRGPSWRVARAAVAAAAERGRADGHEGDPRETVERALQAQIERERRASESGLAVLASIGSTSPFVGLFGTVWGIIHALKAIGSSGSASLEVVAGPIGEALVATAIGIAVAVPAVLAYNFFLRRLKLQSSDLNLLGAALLGAVSQRREPPVALTAAAAEPARRVERAGFDEPREASV
jgi:biopolymer transport protein ExbB